MVCSGLAAHHPLPASADGVSGCLYRGWAAIISIRDVSGIVDSASAGPRPSSASLCQALGSRVSYPDPSVPHIAGLAAAQLLDLALLGDAVVRTAEWISGCVAPMDSHFLF